MDTPFGTKVPKDIELLSAFHVHREAFEKLRRMAVEDSGHESYFSESNLDVRMSDGRRLAYKSLLSDIQHGLILTVDARNNVRFILATGGLLAVGPGWLKGIEYLPGQPEREGTVVQDLDGARKLPPGVYFRQIEPKWFVLYQQTD